jgi:hypothetical protein
MLAGWSVGVLLPLMRFCVHLENLPLSLTMIVDSLPVTRLRRRFRGMDGGRGILRGLTFCGLARAAVVRIRCRWDFCC